MSSNESSRSACPEIGLGRPSDSTGIGENGLFLSGLANADSKWQVTA